MRIVRSVLPYAISTTFLLLFLIATHHHGLGISTDSVSYMRAAEHFAMKGNFEVPLTSWASEDRSIPLSHFPPVLPLILGVLSLSLDIDPISAAYWLNAACIFATSLILLLCLSNSPVKLAVLVTFLLGPSFLYVHLWLWSEPLFLLIGVVAFLTGVNVLAESSRYRQLAVLAVLCGVATLTRYVGIFLFLAFSCLLLLSSVDLRIKGRQLAVYTGIYVVTILPWFLWLSSLETSARSLSLYTNRIGSDIVNDLLLNMVRWLIPAQAPFLLKIMLLAASCILAALLIVGRRHYASESFKGLSAARVSLMLSAIYLGFVVAARLIADPGISFDNRVLTPALIFAAVGFSHTAEPLFARPLHMALGLIIVSGVAMGNILTTAPYFFNAMRNGNGYARDVWKQSETIAWLRELPQNTVIFSNAADAICALLPVPAKYTPSAVELPRLETFQRRFEEARPSVMVLFDDLHKGWILSKEELMNVKSQNLRFFPDSIVMSWGLHDGLIANGS